MLSAAAPAWRWLERHGEESVAGACMVVLASLIFLQVVMRYVFRAPLSWSDEVAVYAQVGLVYFGAAYAVRERAHIRVLAAWWVLPRTAAITLTVLADCLWLGFNLVMVWQGFVLVESFVGQPFYSPALEINLLWPHLIVPFGYALMTARLAQLYLRWARGGSTPFDSPPVDPIPIDSSPGDLPPRMR